MKKSPQLFLKLAMTLCLCVSVSVARAQSCDECDHIITSETPFKDSNKLYGNAFPHTINGTTVYQPVLPGDVVCFKTGTLNRNIVFHDFVGAPGNPILFRNCGGRFTINGGEDPATDFAFTLKFKRSKYLHITGTGDPAHQYGIEVVGSSHAIQMEDFSSDFEIDHLEIHHSNFSGIMAKTDPTCESTDDPTYRNFVLTNVKIHDNYLHHTNVGEALYIGHSLFSSGGASKYCPGKKLWPHSLSNIKIYNNRVEYTGAEGIQLGSCRSNCEIYNNSVIAYGQNPFGGRGDQTNGIQLGEGTAGLCYNNYIHNIPSSIRPQTGNAMNVVGDNNTIFNNIMINPTRGLYINDKPPGTVTGPGTGFKIINNTIVGVKIEGMKLETADVEKNQVRNNIIQLEPGRSAFITIKDPTDTSNNYLTNNINDIQFENPAAFDFRLKASSPAVNAGMNTSIYGVTFDYTNLSRPQGSSYDIGAYERAGLPQDNHPIVNAGEDKTVTLPTSSTTLTGTATDPGGSIASQVWSQVTGPNTATIQTPNALSTSVNGLIEGTYTFKLTATDNTSNSASDNVLVYVKKASPPGSFIVFINAGGDVYTDSNGRTWETDRQLQPHPFLDTSYPTYATGSTSTYSGTDTTMAPVQTLGTYRYTANQGTTINYNIPVPYTGGEYKVRLFFARKNGDTFTSNQRKFDILLEGNVVMAGYDVYDNTVNGATSFTHTLQVNDNTLNISLVAVSGAHVQINDIAVERISSPPVSNAGSDKSVVLPTSTVQLSGTGTDPGGTVTAYAWTQVSGPNQATIQSPTSPVTIVSNLVQGTYTFSLTVTDNDNQTNADNVNVTVHPATQAWSLYINGGGDAYNDGVRAWQTDRQTSPHPYLDSSYPSYATGSTSTYTGETIPGAPNEVLGSYRYTINAATAIHYNIPVPVAGAGYKVDLFFARKTSDTYGPGQRIFDIFVEDTPVETNYDLSEIAIGEASVVTYIAKVHDGMLNIEFIAPTGKHAQINDIAIQKVSDPAPDQVLLAINCGGDNYPSGDLTWEIDRQLSPHQYLDTSVGSTYTTGSSSTFNGDNSTDAPNATLGSYRYTSGNNKTIHYQVPVPVTGNYKVEFYFARKNSDSYLANVRKFDINVEGNNVKQDYDLYEKARTQASFVSYVATVNDNILDINLIGVGGADAQINGLIVTGPVNTTAGTTVGRMMTSDETTQAPESTESILRIYPNPASAHFELTLDENGPYEVQVLNTVQQTFIHERFNGIKGESRRFDISHLRSDHLYIVLVKNAKARKVFKLIKSSL